MAVIYNITCLNLLWWQVRRGLAKTRVWFPLTTWAATNLMLLTSTIITVPMAQFYSAMPISACPSRVLDGTNPLLLGVIVHRNTVFQKTVVSRTTALTIVTYWSLRFRLRWLQKVVLSARGIENLSLLLFSETRRKNQDQIDMTWRLLMKRQGLNRRAKPLLSGGNTMRETTSLIAKTPTLSSTLKITQDQNIKVMILWCSERSPGREETQVFYVWKAQNVLSKNGRWHELGARTLSCRLRQASLRNSGPQLEKFRSGWKNRPFEASEFKSWGDLRVRQLLREIRKHQAQKLEDSCKQIRIRSMIFVNYSPPLFPYSNATFICVEEYDIIWIVLRNTTLSEYHHWEDKLSSWYSLQSWFSCTLRRNTKKSTPSLLFPRWSAKQPELCTLHSGLQKCPSFLYYSTYLQKIWASCLFDTHLPCFAQSFPWSSFNLWPSSALSWDLPSDVAVIWPSCYWSYHRVGFWTCLEKSPRLRCSFFILLRRGTLIFHRTSRNLNYGHLLFCRRRNYLIPHNFAQWCRSAWRTFCLAAATAFGCLMNYCLTSSQISDYSHFRLAIFR